MTIYVDITQLEKGRANTGIQRVVKEFLKRAALCKDTDYKLLIFKDKSSKVEILDNQEIADFLTDMQHYSFKKREEFDLLNFQPQTPTAFFDIDANWNVVYKRADLYPLLKNNGFLIFNFLYDLIPMIFPHFAHEITEKNFKEYIYAVYNYSDLVMFDSFSANRDFLEMQRLQKCIRDIPTRVVGLGSDFLKVKPAYQESKIQNILTKKYLLFVGTVEPRKNQADVLEAFEKLAEKYDDLNLVIIGKKGWKVEDFAQKLQEHPLKDERLFWLDNIDDNTLSQFYQNAFIVTYLSKYEGYGLPIAESLNYANITITSKNSSMYEVGRDFADYVEYGSLNELTSIISLYCDNKPLYDAKKSHIKENFKTTSWEQFYSSISDIFVNYEESLTIKSKHLSSLQAVFISINKHNLERTIALTDRYMSFIKEYIIVTPKKLIEEFSTINSTRKITLIEEESILGGYQENFALRDHVNKNWLLRASLLNIESLEDEFIMLDDDNQPLKEIALDYFISLDGSYNAYYFYHLLEWYHKESDYDRGQHNMKSILSEQNYELLSYSSHAPQIINKKIFTKAVEKFFARGVELSIDEWSIYFNYAASTYPCAFNKKTFETLAWPPYPTDWDMQIIPKTYTFENYYQEQYTKGLFSSTDTLEDKTKKKQMQLLPYIESKEMFKQNRDILAKNNMVHKIVSFKKESIELYLANIPYFIVVSPDSDFKLHLNYKLFNPSKKEITLTLNILLNEKTHSLYPIKIQKGIPFEESIIEVPIISDNLQEGSYNITFDLILNDTPIYYQNSPYLMKLIVSKVAILEQESELANQPTLKERVKAIPLLGWFMRWSYNLLRVNNLKHTLFMQEHTLANMQTTLQQQQETMQNQQTAIQNQQTAIQNQQTAMLTMQEQLQKVTKEYKELQKIFNNQEATIENATSKAVAKQISFHSDALHQQLEQFIFDAKIDLKLKEEK